MKFKIISTLAIFFTTFLVIGSQFPLFSQEVGTVEVKKSRLYVGLSGGYFQNQITNETSMSLPGIKYTTSNSFSGSGEIGYFFSNYFGLSSGIGYSPYQSEVTLDAYQIKFNTVDSENETYERRITGSNIKEVQKIDFFTVPICVNFRLPFSKAVGLFLQTGVNLALPVKKSYSSSGTFSYKGYYPAYNLLLENLPQYGFQDNVATAYEGRLDLKPVNVFGTASVGLDFLVQEKFQIAVAGSFCKSLSNISRYSPSGEFRLSSDINQMKSFMEGSNKVSAQSVGINISFRFFLE